MLINTHASAAAIKTKSGRKKSLVQGLRSSGSLRSLDRSRTNVSNVSSNSSDSSKLIPSTATIATGSGASAGRSSISNANMNPRKKVFDVNKNVYVESSDHLVPSDTAIVSYEQTLQKISEYHYNVLNQKLNLHYLRDSIDTDSNFLLSRKNLDMLRYIYFEDFVSDQNLIVARVKKSAGKLKYLKKINALHKKTKTHKVVRGLPSFGLGEDSPEEDEEEDDDGEEEPGTDDDTGNGEDDTGNYCHQVIDPTSASLNSYSDDTMDSIYAGYTLQYMQQPQSQVKSASQNPYPQPSNSIRSLMDSKSFWNNVYQDVKFDNNEEFEFLPSINQMQEFYIEVMDYVLYNIRTLEIEATPDLMERKPELSSYLFFYLRDQNYEWFNVMSNFHEKLFRFPQHLQYNSVNRGQEESRVVQVLLDTILANIELSVKPISYNHNEQLKNQTEKTVGLWKEFMNFIMAEFILRRENFQKSASSTSQEPTENIQFNPGYNGNKMPVDNAVQTPKETHVFPTLNPGLDRNLSVSSSLNDSLMSARKYGSTSTGFSTPILEAEELFYAAGSTYKTKPLPEIAASKPKRGGFFDKFKKK